MELSRRDFVKGVGFTTGLFVVSPSLGLGRLDKRVKASSPDVGMLVDVSKCIGCWWCYGACKQYNGLPETVKPNPEQPPGMTLTRRAADFSSRFSAAKKCRTCSAASSVRVRVTPPSVVVSLMSSLPALIDGSPRRPSAIDLHHCSFRPPNKSTIGPRYTSLTEPGSSCPAGPAQPHLQPWSSPCASHLSASSAAMQPVPAAVMACR